jgi:hypothetical protein
LGNAPENIREMKKTTRVDSEKIDCLSSVKTFFIRTHLEIQNFHVILHRQIKEKRMTNAGTKKSIISICLLALFISYLASITFFVHTHSVNGQTITHSHPYRGTPDNPGHEHSAAQIQTIAQLSQLLASGVLTIAFACFLAGKKILRNLSIPCFRENNRILSYNLRAPPCSC